VMEQSVDYGMKAVVMNMLYMAVLFKCKPWCYEPAAIAGTRRRPSGIYPDRSSQRKTDRQRQRRLCYILPGFVILMLFMVFVMYNDIIKILH